MTKTLSAAAIQAKEIREALKEAFPGVKFSVRTSNYSMGSSISVKWVDFPTVKTVEEIANKYETVRYDEMGEILSGGNHFIFCSNEWTEETRQEIEKNMPENIDRYDNSYYYWFNRTAEEMESGEIAEEAPEAVETAEIEDKETVIVVEATEVVSEAVEAAEAVSNVIPFPTSKRVEKKEKEANQVPGKVVDLAYLKCEREFKSLTPDQRLKLAVLTEKMGEEIISEAMARGRNIDELFTFYAEKVVEYGIHKLKME